MLRFADALESDLTSEGDFLDAIPRSTALTQAAEVPAEQEDVDRQLTCCEDEINRLESEVALLRDEHSRRRTDTQQVSEQDIDKAL